MEKETPPVSLPSFLSPQLSCQQNYSNSTELLLLPGGVLSSGGCGRNPKYYSYIIVLALIATMMLVQVSHMVKLTLMLTITGAVGVVNIYSWQVIFDTYDQGRFGEIT